MGWSRSVAVVALTTRQRSKEHSSSSPRKAVRPLVVKQTEYSKRERTARRGKSSKVFIFPCHLTVHFNCVFSPKAGDFFPFQGDPARSFSCLFALEESALRSQPGCKGTALCVTALPQATKATSGHWSRGFKVIWRGRPPWNWLLLLRWEGRDSYLRYSKSPNDQSINWCQK